LAQVHAYFVENRGNLNNRSQISISNRWQEINREVGKFVGFVTQIKNRQQSGMTEESRVILIFIFMLNCLTYILTLFNFSNFLLTRLMMLDKCMLLVFANDFN
jgi:hypothetical protein